MFANKLISATLIENLHMGCRGCVLECREPTPTVRLPCP